MTSFDDTTQGGHSVRAKPPTRARAKAHRMTQAARPRTRAAEKGSHREPPQVIDSSRADAQMGNGLVESVILVAYINKPRDRGAARCRAPAPAVPSSSHNTYYVK